MVQAQELITSSDKTPLVKILTWMFLAISVLAAIARITTKLSMVGKLRWDDYLTSISALAAIGQSVAVSFQCGDGFGQHIDMLNENQVSAILKSEHAANIFFIASLFFAKFSVIIFIKSLAQFYKRVVFCLEIGIILWAVSALIITLFQCKLPEPWNYLGNSCIDRVAFWTYFSITNILTDCALIAVMILIASRIQTSSSKKILVMGVFGSRIFVVPAVACQIYFSNKSLNSTDPTFAMWQAVVVAEIVQCLSIVTACVPYLKPFLDSLESGQLRADDLRRRGKTGVSGYGGSGSNPSSGNNAASKSTPVDATASANSQQSNLHELVELPKPKRSSATVTSVNEGTTNWDGQSHSSQTVLIQQTRTWGVDVEVRGVVNGDAV